MPGWCRNAEVAVNGKRIKDRPNGEGYLAIERVWKNGDQITLRLKLEPRLIMGDHGNRGKVALLYGPLVLAADEALVGNADPARPDKAATVPLNAIAVAGPELAMLKVTPEPAPPAVESWPGAQVFRAKAVTRRPLPFLAIGTPLTIRLVPFADAGGTGSRYKVWLPLPRNLYSGNLLLAGQESRSRMGDLSGSIVDEDFETAVTTPNGKTAEEDWFAVQLHEPIMVKRVLFAHGKTFHEGGWFDASAGKPRVQVQRTKDGAWETVAELRITPPLPRGTPRKWRVANRSFAPWQSRSRCGPFAWQASRHAATIRNRHSHPAPSCKRSANEGRVRVRLLLRADSAAPQPIGRRHSA